MTNDKRPTKVRDRIGDEVRRVVEVVVILHIERQRSGSPRCGGATDKNAVLHCGVPWVLSADTCGSIDDGIVHNNACASISRIPIVHQQSRVRHITKGIPRNLRICRAPPGSALNGITCERFAKDLEIASIGHVVEETILHHEREEAVRNSPAAIT